MPDEAQQHSARLLPFRARFRGRLEASWFSNLENVTLTIVESGDAVETTLVAEAPDEAALMGLLNLLYELGCSLISVECPGWSAAGRTDAFGA